MGISWKKGQSCHGFTVTKIRSIPELEAQVYELHHELSGARLMHVACADTNKVFCVAFRTLPSNDTGVAHIMEHSVLCGSRRYKLKEPFVELMKGSLQTFLNAMTYPDMTVYPVASCNEQDLHNLMEVYLDAVYFPELSPEAFRQEGWHHEVDAEGRLGFKGVVYNEMQGAYSSPETHLHTLLGRTLYTGSPYQYDSGGVPEAIPSLSYEAYRRFHERHYHPSNSWIYLYGDLDLEAALKHLDEGYLDQFQARRAAPPAPPRIRSTGGLRRASGSYSVNEGDQLEKRSFMLLSWLTGACTDAMLHMEMDILDHVLIGTSASPLRAALERSGIGEEVLRWGFNGSMARTSYSIGLKNADAARLEEFRVLVQRTLQNIVNEGFDKRLVEGAVNKLEFRLREASFGSYPKGLVYGLNVLSPWMWGADPVQHLCFEAPLAKLKERLARGSYLEGLVQKYLLGNKEAALIELHPDPKMKSRAALRERRRLQAAAKRLGEAGVTEARKLQQRLEERQRRQDAPAEMAKLPRIHIRDLERQHKPLDVKLLDWAGVKLLRTDTATSGVVYLSLVFKVDFASVQELRDIALLSDLMLRTGAGSMSYQQLSMELNAETGGTGFSMGLQPCLDGSIERHVMLSTKIMAEHGAVLERLLLPILQSPRFDEAERLREILTMDASSLRSSIAKSGEWAARITAGAAVSAIGKLKYDLEGPPQLERLDALVRDWKTEHKGLDRRLSALAKRIFRRGALTVSVTCRDDDFARIEPHLRKVVQALPAAAEKPVTLDLKPKRENVGLASSGNVQYVCRMVNLHEGGFAYDGTWQLVNQLLSTGFLWNKVRVEGGAYGCFLSFDRFSGQLNLCSYRDPNLEKTLEHFKALGAHLRELSLNPQELEKLIVGVVGRLDFPLTPSQKGARALDMHMRRITDAEQQLYRDQILAASAADLRVYAEWFERLAQDGVTVVHGPVERIRAAAGLFDRIEVISGGSGGDDDEEEDDDDDDDSDERHKLDW